MFEETKDYTFRWGDICWFEDPIPFDDNSHILHGARPVVIVSCNRLNETSSLATIAPMTTNVQKKLYANQIEINLNGTRSRIKCDQIRVVDKSRLSPPPCKSGSGRDGRTGERPDGCPWHRNGQRRHCKVGCCQ